MTIPPSHIMIGLSGGVDSSIAAYLLKTAGHRVTAVFMKNWEGDDTDTYCAAAKDLADAQAVCDQLHIELQVVNFADRYWQRVFTYFLAEYRAGRTPNPDILCNKEIKFSAFLDYAKQQGADYIATGHYARIEQRDSNGYLLKGRDTSKDQSYFLHALNQTQLANSCFPLGDLAKTEVRALAKQLGLKTHDKKDSTGICFIGERKFKTFLNDYLPAQPGRIETPEGEILGQHDGLMFYTIGQRQGLHIGGKKGKAEQPWYVAAKDLPRNALIVVQGDQHPALFQQTLQATALHWINSPPTLPLQTAAKIRYRQADQPCMIESLEPLDEQRYCVHFEQPQRAITPGQSIVFYQDDICLGGGIIS
ncbi:MAG TPA: tRNA 2-thiouridine(34) synthase MnmA [Gammaproteobacteria bacterium]|jgi:tRNA-specific 2-thiouridylase|nr:tRNA 2-thiouridine(34) synthase MnmA [Gammaproteobacteria bacterium]